MLSTTRTARQFANLRSCCVRRQRHRRLRCLSSSVPQPYRFKYLSGQGKVPFFVPPFSLFSLLQVCPSRISQDRFERERQRPKSRYEWCGKEDTAAVISVWFQIRADQQICFFGVSWEKCFLVAIYIPPEFFTHVIFSWVLLHRNANNCFQFFFLLSLWKPDNVDIL